MSSSLPTTNYFPASLSATSTASGSSSHKRRRPSLDLHAASVAEGEESSTPHLRFEPQARTHLIAPPPRALTQYVASTSVLDGEDVITLPSTIGLRSAGLSTGHAEVSMRLRVIKYLRLIGILSFYSFFLF
jgi:hypothetical protein